MNLTQQQKERTNKQQNIGLSPRQWELYRLVKERTLKGLKTTCKDICEAMPEQYKLKVSQSNYSNCPLIYEDCEALLLSSEVEKVIIAKNNDFRIATSRKEAMRYANKLAKRAAHRFKRYWAIKDKCDRNGEGKTVSCQNVAITDESNARKFVEAFLTLTDTEEEDVGD